MSILERSRVCTREKEQISLEKSVMTASCRVRVSIGDVGGGKRTNTESKLESWRGRELSYVAK